MRPGFAPILGSLCVPAAVLFAFPWVAEAGATKHAAPAAPLCEPSPAVRRALDSLDSELFERMPAGKRRTARVTQLRTWLRERPDDFFLQRSLQSRSRRDALVEEYERLLSAHPGDPRYLYLYGRALFWSERKKEAIAQFRQAAKRDPRFPWSYLGLAASYSSQPGKDTVGVRREVRRFWEICPDTLEIYRYVPGAEDDRFKREALARLRKTLETRSDTEAISYWSTLWAYEFRLRPQAEHPVLRQEIGRDLERLRSLGKTADKQWYQTMHEGYEMAGDRAQAQWAEKQFLDQFAYTDEAFDWVQEDWMDKHPYPGDRKSPEAKAYSRALYRESAKWIQEWPNNVLARFDRLDAAAELNELSNREVLAAADGFLTASNADPEGIRGVPPLEFRVVRVYLDRDLRLERVPALIEEVVRKEEERLGKGSRGETEMGRLNEDYLEATRWAGWPLLAEAYLKLGRPKEARKVVARMEQALSESALKNAASKDAPAAQAKKNAKVSADADSEDRAADRALAEAWHRGLMFHWKGRIAQAEKHSADAWTYYRAALIAMPASVTESRDRLEADARGLWEKLGGTQEGWLAALEKSPGEGQAASEDTASGWQTKSVPLPDFEMTDFAGRRWTQAELKGKITFINLWATWCGPCRTELPHLQKLHERLRGRSDVQVLTFNIDGNPGIVEPYLTQQGYTFPTLPASAYVSKMVGSVGIPRNWIVNREGKLISEQVGFGGEGDQQWADQILARIEKALAGP